MMLDELLSELRRRDIRIWAEGDRLKYEAPYGALTDDLLALLRLHKEDLIKRSEAAKVGAPAPIPRANRNNPLPLSFSQQRMWFLWKLAPDSPAYNIPCVVKLAGRLNLGALAKGLRTIRRRHEVLRTRFVETPDSISQVIEEDGLMEMPVIDLTGTPPAEREAEAKRRMLQEVAKPFDLTREAPFEVRLYRLAEDSHWLFIKLHHIAIDGRSYAIFMTELSSIYSALNAGRPCALKELPIQYADFAAWQRERFRGALREGLLSYWKNQLGGELAALSLPTDRPRNSVKSMRGDSVWFELSPALSSRLAELTHSQHSTLFMVLMSAFRVLLYRYSGQTDFLIATPTLWRSHVDTEPLIGYFANTLVLRNQLRPQDNFLQVLAGERKTALDAYEHQEIPFDLVVEEVAPERALSHSPLFQVMFAFGERDLDNYPMPDLKAEFTDLETSTAKFDLRLWVQEVGAGGLRAEMEYDSELFERETIARMASHLEVLLTNIVRRPESRIGEIPLLTAGEQHQLRRWNDTARPLPPVQCLHEMFEAQVRAHPHSIAVYHGEGQVTYAELDGEANHLARRLVRLSVRPEQLVGVCMRRSPHLVAALLGVLKAGAAYVPIDPSYPPEHIKLILDDSRIQVLLTESAVIGRLPELDNAFLLLREEGAAETVALPFHPDNDRAIPENLAYVLYTSGSTGRPKGVMIEHRSAAALLHWAYSVYSSEELAGVLAATSVCFDLSIFELFAPLCAGHSVVLAENALELPLLPVRERVTLLNTVPSVMQALLQLHGAAFPNSLRVVNLAGERLDTTLVDEVYRRTRASKVYDLYGPTEATTYSIFKLRLPGQPPTIGRPICNTRAYVLNECGMHAPTGAVGELYLAGAGLARGYLHRPDLTAERFVPPRSTGILGERLYRTGDLVRFTTAGEIEYRGRNDDQVKIRGFRVEPGEVKGALLTAEGVEDAFITADRGRDGVMSLTAYIVGDPALLSPEQMRLNLKKSLPEFMIPSAFVPVNALPLTPNGKVDVKRLETPKERARATTSAAPQTETERRILDIWKEALDVEHIGVHDNFFEFGGHSLTAMRATARVSDAFNINLPLRAIFLHPTVYELASDVELIPRGARASALPPLRARGRVNSPLTLLQKHFLLLHCLVRNPAILNIKRHVSIRGKLNLTAAEQALRTLAGRHPILKAKFILDAGRIRQDVASNMSVTLPVEDLSSLQGEAAVRQALASISEDAARPFDIGSGPCARFVLVRLSEDHHVLIMVLHHLIGDEWSLGVLNAEFAVCYGAFANELPSPLPLSSITFDDYAAWEEECLEQHLFDEQLSWWEETLRPPLPRLTFSWQQGESDAEERVESYVLELEPLLCDRLAAVARRERTSLFVVLLSALNRLLHSETGESDIRVCTNIARRHQRGLESVVGLLTDTLVLRTKFPAGHTPLGALWLTRNTFLAACGHQDVPFPAVTARLVSDSGVRREDLAQAFFLFHEQDQPMPPLPGLASEEAPVFEENNFFKSAMHGYGLILYLSKSGGGISGQLTLRGRLADGSAGAKVLSKYRLLLEELSNAE
jgi:amino acid adenylation domain-containing protein